LSQLSRRALFAQLAGVAALPSALGCRRELDQRAVLRALVLQVAVPNAEALLRESRRLDLSLRAVSESSTGEEASSARTAFRRALLVWKRCYAFRIGPFASSNVFLRAMFWPARPKSIEAVLSGERAIDGALVDALGVDAKGLFGLEYLLFSDSGQGAGDSFGARRKRYALEISSNVMAYAERNLRLLGDGRGYAQSFAEHGRDSENRLVAQMIDSVELLVGKLERVLRFNESGALQASHVKGYFSGTSLDIAISLLAGTEALYAGGGGPGLCDRVAPVSTAIDERLRAAFGAAHRALQALRVPLEQCVKANSKGMRSAVTAVRALELALRVDLKSALGITLTFSSGDGD
jgi:predicted lipoprotein